jgi:pimeloyl-ACP methyl ester carboxylesterase
MSSFVSLSECANNAAEPIPEGGLSQLGQTAELTIIIHGNKAAQEPWWRPGTVDSPSFADHLERALAARSKPNTVWKPALAQGFRCDEFTWSGKNSHSDRLRAARRLSSTLTHLAKKLGSTAERPLLVNLVGHSHGGNVCLQAMKYLGKEVRIRSAVFMGTPLVRATPSFRPARFMLAPPLLTFILLAGMASVALVIAVVVRLVMVTPAILSFQWIRAAEDANLGTLLAWVMVVGLSPLIYGVLFRFVCWIADGVWRFTYSIWLKLTTRRQIGEVWRAYGPSEALLLEMLESRAILNLSIANDEADVLLQSVVAPRRVYSELAKRLRGIAWWLGVLFRAVDLFLRCVECICEFYALGLPGFRALFFDHEIVNASEYDYYPRSLFVHEAVRIDDIDDALLPANFGNSKTCIVTVNTITDRILSVFDEISSRVPLWHSAYHQSNQVVGRIADHIVGTQVAESSRAMVAAG